MWIYKNVSGMTGTVGTAYRVGFLIPHQQEGVSQFDCPDHASLTFPTVGEAASWCSFLNGGMHPTFSTLLRTQVEKLVTAIHKAAETIKPK